MNKLKYLLMILIFVGYVFATNDYSVGQTGYRGDLRGDRIVLEVKTKTTAINPYVAVQWDTTAFRIFRTYSFPNNHLTTDSLSDTLSKRDASFFLRARSYGSTAANICTLIAYGSYLTDWWYSTNERTVGSETVKYTGNQLNTDSLVAFTKSWYDIDSVRVRASASVSGLCSVRFEVIPKNYVLVADSGNINIAGISIDTIKLDTTGIGAGGSAKSGYIAIWGITKAAVTATPGTYIRKGDLLQTSTSAGFLKKWNRLSSPSIDTLITHSLVAKAMEEFYPNEGVYKDTIRVKIP